MTEEDNKVICNLSAQNVRISQIMEYLMLSMGYAKCLIQEERCEYKITADRRKLFRG
jgi:hypothetical protein